MSFYGRSSNEPATLSPLQQVRAVWVALAAVLLTLSLLFVAYGWRSFDFTVKRGLTQSQSRAELTRSQVFNAFRHMDDILLQTKSVFDRAGPGIASQPELLAQSPALLGLPPYTCIGIVNAQGDAFLRIPDGCVLPDIAARASEFQPTGESKSRLLTDAFAGSDGLKLVRAVHLYYADQTFAGMVLAVLSTDYVFSVFKGLMPDEYRVTLGVAGEAFRIVGQSGAQEDVAALASAKTVLEFDGLSGPVRLDIRSLVSQSAALDEWKESVLWPFMGYLVVFGGLVQGARLLTRALRQQMVSDLMAQRARVESEVQSRFIANISHEVRTPMNGVLGAARLLSKTTLSESQRQLLGLVERSGKVLLGTINDLLDIGKLREGEMKLEQRPVDLIELLEDSCALQAPQAHAKGLELVVTLDLPERLGAMGDALRIQQVVTNLLNNAVKFTAEGMVSLTASLYSTPKGSNLKVEVTDSGIGIDLTVADWLFQPFQQADASTARRFGGTGLGLAITDQLVRLMGGLLEVQSQPGLGTTFTARWPLVLSDAIHSEGDAARQLPMDLVCELDLPDTKAGQRERKALARHLDHLGVGVMTRQTRLRRRGRGTVRGTSPKVVLADETCLSPVRPEWLDQQMAVLVLSREPGLFKAPPHLDGLRWKVLGKPTRRSALKQALLQAGLEEMNTAPWPLTCLTDSVPDTVGILPTESLTQTAVKTPHHSSSDRPEGLNILVAEDHAVNQILIRHMLTQAGCRVHLVHNGNVAVETLFNQDTNGMGRFDLVLMDCQMPELDGFSATAKIRHFENARGDIGQRIPIIAMTALAMPEDMQRCLDSGMDDYCSKPIDERVLLEKIFKWTELQH